MNKWLVSFLALILVGGAAKYIMMLRNENAILERKLHEAHDNIAQLKHTIEVDERQLDKTNVVEKQRVENINQLILAKKKELEGVVARIASLSQNPDSKKAKADAEADLKLEKDRIATLENQIKGYDQAKAARKNESQDDRQIIESRFRTQDNNLNYQIKSAEDNLHALENELKAIKVIRNDPVAISAKNSKAQEIVNQKAYVSDLHRQKRDLAQQYNIQKNEMGASLNADQTVTDQQAGSLRGQLKDERSRLDALEKTLKSFSNSEEGIRNQIKVLQTQKQSLEREIAELEASR